MAQMRRLRLRPSTSAHVVGVVRSAGESTSASDSFDDDAISDEPGATPSSAMLEFAEAGFPSDEDDVMDPRARDRAMNRVVEEIQELNKAEEDILNKAFALAEKLMPGARNGLGDSTSAAKKKNEK